MRYEQLEHLPLELMEEGLVDHLILAHNVSPDELYDLKSMVVEGQWVSFLVRGHYILHMLQKHGEYHDEQFHFKASDYQ